MLENSKFTSAITPPTNMNGRAYWFVFSGYRLLVHSDESIPRIPLASNDGDLKVPLVRSQYLGYLELDEGIIHCFSGEAAEDTAPPEGFEFAGLRRLFGSLDEELLSLAGRAVQIKEWDRTHQFCGNCGSRVIALKHERAKKCPECELTTYPRLSPAIIVSVERPTASGTELLLARNRRHPDGFFSVLAGFVEPGESLEECVRREVCEEVGIDVTNIRYFGSQPWPFPHSLMIAFTAEYAGGEIRLEEEELVEAGWFSADSLPLVPPRVSIARQMIDAFIKRNRHSSM